MTGREWEHGPEADPGATPQRQWEHGPDLENPEQEEQSPAWWGPQHSGPLQPEPLADGVEDKA